MLMKEVEDDRNIWKDIPCSWIGIINIVNMTTLPKAIEIFNAIPINYKWHFCRSRTKSFFNLYGNTKDPE